MDERDLDPDPLRQFQRWFAEARDAGIAGARVDGARDRDGPDGRPSVRMVLLKGADERGFAFYTNYESRKGGELAANPHAALLFHWQPLGRQVRVEGRVERIPAEESEPYFRTRPLGSRLAAWASPQSRPLAEPRRARAPLRRGRGALSAAKRCRAPPHWGGFRLVPDAYEFWEHAENRLHDRIRYERDGDAWNAPAGALARLVPEERAGGLVRGGVVRLPEQLHQAPEHVADADHPEQVTALSTTGRWRIFFSPISLAASRTAARRRP